MTLIQSTPLSERQFNDPLIQFNSSKAMFNYLEGTGFGVESILSYHMFMGRTLLTNIDVYTAYIKYAFARKLLSTVWTTDILEYNRRLWANTRFSKIYIWWNRWEDSPGALYGVRN